MIVFFLQIIKNKLLKSINPFYMVNVRQRSAPTQRAANTKYPKTSDKAARWRWVPLLSALRFWTRARCFPSGAAKMPSCRSEGAVLLQPCAMAIAPKRFGDGILLRHCVTIKWRLLAVWRNSRSVAPYCQQLPFLGAQDYKRWQRCLVCEPFIADNVPQPRSAAATNKFCWGGGIDVGCLVSGS